MNALSGFHKAMAARFNLSGNAFNVALGGRFWFAQAPEKLATMPYAVWFHVACVENDTFTEKIDDRMVQISIFAASSAACIGLAEKALDLFDGATLAGEGIKDATLVRGSIIGPEADGEAAWHVAIEFNALVEQA